MLTKDVKKSFENEAKGAGDGEDENGKGSRCESRIQFRTAPLFEGAPIEKEIEKSVKKKDGHKTEREVEDEREGDGGQEIDKIDGQTVFAAEKDDGRLLAGGAVLVEVAVIVHDQYVNRKQADGNGIP